MNTLKTVLILVLIASSSLISQNIRDPKRIDLSSQLGLDSNQYAQIFIPETFKPGSKGFDLVFHLHGNSKTAETQIKKTEADAILFNIYLGLLSSPYREYFEDSTKFGIILNTVKDTLASSGIVDANEIDDFIITSFSAGYGGVREMLKYERYYRMIDVITLADGLHSDLDSALMKKQMKDFTRFAKDATEGEKIMVLTHSNIEPENYASTTETADYLIERVNGERFMVSRKDSIGRLYSEFHKGNLYIKGYRGDTAEDHMKHLYHIDKMLSKVLEILNN